VLFLENKGASTRLIPELRPHAFHKICCSVRNVLLKKRRYNVPAHIITKKH